MKKLLVIVVAAVLIASLIMGCTRSNPSDGQVTQTTTQGTTTGGSTTRDITITEMVSQGWSGEAEEGIARQFTVKTGIKVEIQIIPADQHHDLLKTRLNAGEGPDVFWIQTNPFAIKTELDPEKNCIDFTEESWVGVMSPERLPAVSYNGRVYGLMLWHNSPEFTFFYNKTLFSELGIHEPPASYEAFKDAAQTILDAGIVPIYEYVPAGWHHVLPFAMIGGRYEEANPGLFDRLNNNEIKMADVPEMLLVLQQMKEFADLGFYGEDYMSNDGSSGVIVEQLATRQAAMVTANPGMARLIQDTYPENTDEFGLFLIPFADNQTYPVNPSGPARFGYKMSRYVEEVKEYFRFVTEKENLQYKLDNTPSFTNLDVTVDIEQRWLPLELELVQRVPENKYKTILQTGVKYINEQWMEIGKDLEALFLGVITPEQVLANIDERRARMANAQGDPAWE